MISCRKEGGRLLAGRLAERRYVEPVVVVLSKGGVPVGLEIAQSLRATLRSFGQSENGSFERPSSLAQLAPEDVDGHSIILVDEWLASADSLRAVLENLRRLGTPRRVVLATPAALEPCLTALSDELDAVFCIARLKQAAEFESIYADAGSRPDPAARNRSVDPDNPRGERP
jgi:predicted phosphoribosyltransferase